MQERRRHIRVVTPVMIQFPNPSTMKTERSYTHDVSESGLKFPTLVKFELNQEIPLTLELPFHDATMHATGVVAWIREIARHGATQYEVGVQFRWLEDPDRQRLIRHLTTLFRR